jgi:hypothetical protein
MKMKKELLITILGFIVLNCFSQDVNDKFLIGASIGFSHDDLNNNRLLSNYFAYDKNYSNTFDATGEFGYFLTPDNLLGIEIEYHSNRSKQERKTTGVQNSDVLNTKSSGISINPKYKFIKRFSDKIWFYTDFKVVYQYLSHENKVTQLNVETYEYEYVAMNGTELKYGLAIDPGLIFKINKSFGIKIDYSLINVFHSTIKKTDDSDINFDKIEAWDYGLNMKLSGFKLGMIFTL